MHSSGVSADVSAPARRPWLLPVVTLAATALAWFATRAEGKVSFPLDDSYIVLHAIDVAATGRDAAFPGTPWLAGVTSPVFAVLALVLRAFLGGPAALQMGNALGVGALTAGLVRVYTARPHTRLLAPLAVLVAFVAGRALLHYSNGLETGLACATLVWLLALADGDETHTGPALPLLAGVAPFVRPELGLLSLLLLGDRALARRALDPRAQATALARDLGWASLAALPWAALNLRTLGALLPNTVEAKAAFFAESCEPFTVRAQHVMVALIQFAVHLGPALLGGVLLGQRRAGRVAWAFALGMLLAYGHRLPGALMHNQQRYTQLLAPLGLVGIAFARDTVNLRRVQWALLGLALVYGGITLRPHLTERTQARMLGRGELRNLSRWVRASLPPGSVLLAHDIGYLSATTSFRMVDLVGLRTPSSVASHRAHTLATCGAGRGDAVVEIARRTHPTHLVVYALWDGLFHFTDALHRAGFGIRALHVSPGGYAVLALDAPP